VTGAAARERSQTNAGIRLEVDGQPVSIGFAEIGKARVVA
jgi:hypothetical protein